MTINVIHGKMQAVLLLASGACVTLIAAMTVNWSFGMAPSTSKTPGIEAVAQWAPHPGPPPIRRFFGLELTQQFLKKGNVRGELNFYARATEVKIAWTLIVGSRFMVQKIPLSYWPTWTLTSGDGLYLYIGGKRRSNGNTVIERLLIGDPIEVIDVQNPNVSIILPAPILEVVTMYDEATEGRDYVSAILEKRIGSDELLVHFDDSGDVYELQWDEGSMTSTLTLVASVSSSSSSVVTAVGLNRRAPIGWTAEHSTLGYVYIFGQGTTVGPHETVVLFDDNLDGDLDGAMTLDTVGWEANGLHDTANYVTIDK